MEKREGCLEGGHAAPVGYGRKRILNFLFFQNFLDAIHNRPYNINNKCHITIFILKKGGRLCIKELWLQRLLSF